jgi:hypothetical protein
MRILTILTVLAWLAGCANQSPSGPTLAAAGDERGGTIPNGAANMAASMNTVRAHCEQFGKKGFIVQMKLPAEGGLITFECH